MSSERVSPGVLLNEPLPALRLSPEEVLRQAAYFDELPFFREVTDGVADIILVLNRTRQIVSANKALCDRFGLSREDVIGKRPGEGLSCIHGPEGEGGCGTTEFCRACGAAKALYAAGQLFKTDLQECRIRREIPRGDLDLQVKATPMTVHGEPFTLFCITDVRHEKRRRALERVFFSDVLRLASNIAGLSELLKDGFPEKRSRYEDLLLRTSRALVREIHAQKFLSIAESGELIVTPSPLPSRELMEKVVAVQKSQAFFRDRRITIDRDCASVTVASDRTLLSRALESLLINALESTEEDREVILGCRADPDAVAFWVWNPGMMSEAVRLQIFQRSFSTKKGGGGLGTYSVKLLVERYLGGCVSFESSEKAGTVFTITLPRPSADIPCGGKEAPMRTVVPASGESRRS